MNAPDSSDIRAFDEFLDARIEHLLLLGTR